MVREEDQRALFVERSDPFELFWLHIELVRPAQPTADLVPTTDRPRFLLSGDLLEVLLARLPNVFDRLARGFGKLHDGSFEFLLPKDLVGKVVDMNATSVDSWGHSDASLNKVDSARRIVA